MANSIIPKNKAIEYSKDICPTTQRIPKIFEPLRVGSAIAARPTLAIESPNRYANEPVIPLATLIAF